MRVSTGRCINVVTDASYLINFLLLGRLDILGSLKMYIFHLTNHVREQIHRRGQRKAIDTAMSEGFLKEIELTSIDELRTFAECTKRFGEADASCLAITIHRGWSLATDDAHMRNYIGNTVTDPPVLTTPGTIVRAVKEGMMTLEEADALIPRLKSVRFGLKFKSFREFVK